MALDSRHLAIMTAIRTVLTNDTDLTARNFKIRKKPYARGNTWVAGGYIVPKLNSSPYHETQIDELVFSSHVVIVNPEDADLESNIQSHLGAIERIKEIFRRKSGSFLPASIAALNTTFAAMTTAGVFPATVVEMTNAVDDATFVDQAFEAGFDVSACLVNIHVRANRYTATSL